MGRKRIAMSKLRDIIRLHVAGNLSERQIHRALHVSRPAVSKYINAFDSSGLLYAEIKELSDIELVEILGLNNQKKNTGYEDLYNRFPGYVKELTRVGVTRYILWEEYKSEKPEGYSYSQFCYHLQNWINSSKLSMHIAYKAGDKMLIDFSGKKLYFIDPISGEQKAAEVFIAVLGASKIIYAEPVLTQQTHDWISANQNSLLYFGGVPRAIVPDCLKSGVTKGNKYQPDINPEYSDFAEHYNTVILPARPYSPKDKAIVEQAVKIIYQNIFARIRNQIFYSLEELKKAVFDQLQILNSKPMQHFKVSRFELFNEVEKNELMPLPATRYERRYFKKLKVQSDYHIYLSDDLHYYSVPFSHRNKRVKVIFTDKNVEIYRKNVRIALHKRDKTANGYSTNPDHMPHNHRYIYDWNPQKFIDRASEIGIETKKIVIEILKISKHPEQGYKMSSGILALASKYGKERIEKASHICLLYNNLSYQGVNNILKNGMENLIVENEEAINSQQLPDHENIRGKEYYLQLYNQ